jgi:hypothetical protein
VEKRRLIRGMQRVDDEYMANWFRYQPASFSAPKQMAPVRARSQAAKT